MNAIIPCDRCVELRREAFKRPARVFHIIAGIEKKTGEKPVMPVNEDGAVVIPERYLAMMGLAGGGSLKFTPCAGGVVIERADPADVAD